MLLLRDDKLVRVDCSERPGAGKIIATKQPKSGPYTDTWVRARICELTAIRVGDDIKFVFKTVQSPYSDNSGMGHGMGVYDTRGAAIYHILRKSTCNEEGGWVVTRDGIEITLDCMDADIVSTKVFMLQ